MIRSLVACCAAALLLAACASKKEAAATVAAADAPPTIEHLATNRQVMLGLTIPASDVVFQAGSKGPPDDAEWDRIVANAVMLAESGNLMLTGPRDLKQPEWTQFARELVARSKVAAEAAGKHDVDAVLEAGNGIYEVCENCHNKYMPAKVAEQAAGGAGAQPAQ